LEVSYGGYFDCKKGKAEEHYQTSLAFRFLLQPDSDTWKYLMGDTLTVKRGRLKNTFMELVVNV